MNAKTKVAVILAGGLGTRLQSVVSEVPKPMAPVGGKPFLDIILRYWIDQGITRFIISVGYKYESIINYFGDIFEGISIEYIIEKEPLGTGGGLLKVLSDSIINEQFLIVNGDTFFSVDLVELENFHFENKSKWTIALFKSTDRDRYMQFHLTQSNEIIDIMNCNSNDSFFSNGGIYLLDNKNIIIKNSPNKKKFSLEADIIPKIIGKNSLFGFYADQTFIDIGIPKDYESSKSILSKYL
jgi:D-glycero-alpha-D-manno-heptose 1-phosphate guanylyltransferase